MPRHVESEDSDWVDAQADLSLRWAHMSFVFVAHFESIGLVYPYQSDGSISISRGVWCTLMFLFHSCKQIV